MDQVLDAVVRNPGMDLACMIVAAVVSLELSSQLHSIGLMELTMIVFALLWAPLLILSTKYRLEPVTTS